MTPRQRLQVALEIAVRRLERQAPLGGIVADLQDAISDVSCELISNEHPTEHEEYAGMSRTTIGGVPRAKSRRRKHRPQAPEQEVTSGATSGYSARRLGLMAKSLVHAGKLSMIHLDQAHATALAKKPRCASGPTALVGPGWSATAAGSAGTQQTSRPNHGSGADHGQFRSGRPSRDQEISTVVTKNEAGQTGDLQEAAKVATSLRKRAETELRKAEEAHTAARQHRVETEARIDAGDKAVSRDMFADAEFEVRRTAGAVSLAKETLAKRIHEERTAVAQAAASELIEGASSREVYDQAVAAAQAGVTEALTVLREAAQRRNAAITGAIARAKEAGLEKADAFSPVRLELRGDPKRSWSQQRTPVLVVLDEEAETVDVEKVLRDTAAGAVAAVLGAEDDEGDDE